MSENLDRIPTGSPPKTERWVKVTALSFAPAVLALFTPEMAHIPLLVVAGSIFVASMVLMVRDGDTSRHDARERERQ